MTIQLFPGLEKLHPFDSTKYQSVFSALRETHSVIADDNDGEWLSLPIRWRFD